jgi:hypothetical protein
MPVADIAHAPEVAGRRCRAALRRATDRLGNEGNHSVRSQGLDLGFQLLRQPRTVGSDGFASPPVPIGIGRGDVMGLKQHRSKLLPAHGVAADGKRAEGVAMIALSPSDEVPPLQLSLLDKVLPRHLQRGLHGLGTAGNKIDVIQAMGRMGY